ncbi:hypothetical protein GGTG_01115 [Gaeumannomyces tritici R3-111a-1]|uniref:Uncharacterized protein n=1 Tax=Gaeumannomyces tritici (strain R3-111a-1) TaxID=644352 RepID=J3NIN1_GAET3|nr:hypothetical protein GGTG_01115 [Gaeumannomyces tritici R3-111a-1]EJT81130.1 hypothetical protein GGTG_01115 [Gaeumannomyces tritici R3-111a-1]
MARWLHASQERAHETQSALVSGAGEWWCWRCEPLSVWVRLRRPRTLEAKDPDSPIRELSWNEAERKFKIRYSYLIRWPILVSRPSFSIVDEGLDRGRSGGDGGTVVALVGVVDTTPARDEGPPRPPKWGFSV